MPAGRLVLASGSPRRAAFLQRLGLTFDQLNPDVDETRRPGEAPADYVARLAETKAQRGASLVAKPSAEGESCIVVAADTAVTLGDVIFGKPSSEADALRMLRALEGRQHQVLTGYCVLERERMEVEVVSSLVTMRHMSDDDIVRYWRTGEPRDKAGAYAVQGEGGAFVADVAGSYSAVVGLPVSELAASLARFGVHCSTDCVADIEAGR